MLPMVSIVVLNWNGEAHLKRCLVSLQKVTYKPLEIIIVDNGSIDNSCEFVKKKYPSVILVKNNQNFGFAKGNNIGFKKAKGDYVVFLNNDTEVASDFLYAMIEEFKQDKKVGCIQPQMRVLDKKNILDQAGAFLTNTGFLYHYGYYKVYNTELYGKKRKVFSVKGACMIVSRDAFEKIGGFDEDFFIFFEETDLCFRMWIAGYDVIYQPASLIYHLTGGDTTSTYKYPKRVFLTYKNMLICYTKNFGTVNLITIFPFFIIMQIMVFFYFLIKLQFAVSSAMLSAYGYFILHIGETLKKRHVIQYNLRKRNDAEINKEILRNPPINYYYYLLRDLKKFKDISI